MTDVPEKYAHLQRWAFGDNPKLADELLALVLIGKKTASCGALSEYEDEAWPIPNSGDRWIVLDGAQRPRCVIETTELKIQRFDQVDAKLAHDEGEGDQSYAFWRNAHEEYFTRQGRFAPDMMLVCERFRLVEVLTPSKEAVQ